MKNFFRDTSDTIVKLLSTQLGMTIFGLMLTMTTRVLPGAKDKERDPVVFWVSLASIFLYLFLIYTHIWEKGAKDRIKVDGGRMENQPLKGLWITLIANSLNLLLGIIMCCTYYLCDFVSAPNSIACQIFGSANDIARIIQGMYAGLILYISPEATSTSPFLFIAIVLPAILVTTFGYLLGFGNKRLIKSNKKTTK